MKQLLIALYFMLLSLLSIAQNGGQYAENNSLRLEYVKQGGTHYTQITNKLNRQIMVRVDYAGQITETTIAANSVYLYPLGVNPTSFAIKAKNLYCSGNDCGWVELMLTALPVKFTNFTCEHVAGDEYLIKFTIAEASNVKQFNIQLSHDSKTYRNIAVVWPDELQPNKQYSLKIKIKS